MIKKSLKLKLLIAHLAILTLCFGVYSLLNHEYSIYIALPLFPILSLIILNSTLHKPLKKIIKEMKALLIGKSYHKIFTTKTDEIGIIGHFFNEITESLEKISSDLKEHQKISEELNLAQKIQRDLIPKEAPEIPYLEITAKTKSAAQIGGDNLDFLQREKDTYFYVGDVTGHGIPAGLVMIMVDTLISTFVTMAQNTKDLVVNTNKFLKPRLQKNMFMTMVMFRWLHEEKKMYFTGAGHEHVIHYKTTEKKCDTILSGGIALGMLPDNEKITNERELNFQTGDLIILYSDGITEAKNQAGEQFGLKRLVSLIEKKADTCKTTKELFNHIAGAVTIFMENSIQEDDMSLIVIKHKSAEAKPLHEKESTEWSSTQKDSLINYEKQDIKETGIQKK